MSATETSLSPAVASRAAPAAARLRDGRRVVALAPLLGMALLVACAFTAYSRSFASIPIIERRHSVLGDADAANFALLLRDFSLRRTYGNPYQAHNRSLGDNAQKHKIHHLLYAMVGGPLDAALRSVGFAPDRALYSVNALIGCLNLLLLALLLRRVDQFGSPVLPFLLLYAAALSTWVITSVPESWPFSGTLVLLYLLLLDRRPRAAVAGAVLGVFMLNNIYLTVLVVLVPVGFWRAGLPLRRALAAGVRAGVVALGVWALCLTALSFFDPSLRPDEFIRFTLWFKRFTQENLPPWALYPWKSAFTNLFISSIVSNQPDPAIPQDALLVTLRQSRLGLAATALYVALAAVALVGAVRRLGGGRVAVRLAAAVRDSGSELWIWCVAMLVWTVVVFYQSGFLYSTVVTPCIVALLYRNLDLRARAPRLLFYTFLAVMLVNNTLQVLAFRAALLRM